MLILRRSLPILADGAVFSCHCAVLPYMSQGGVADFVTEDSETISVTVNGMKGQLFLAKDWKNTRSTLTWIDTDNNIQFTLMAALNETDILHMAESVSLVKTEK